MNQISDYAYYLPEELIAQTPSKNRSNSRLMVLNRLSGKIYHRKFYDILEYLNQGDALVLNDTKVIPARIEAHRSSGGRVELFLLEEGKNHRWKILARPTARLKEGEKLSLVQGGKALLITYEGQGVWESAFEDLPLHFGVLDLGRMPLPHYIVRNKESDPRDELDRERYQTVYAASNGAVAAPTAGLHFTKELLQKITHAGVHLVTLTLHVGVGTFAPVRDEDFTRHRMHSERFLLSAESADALNEVKRNGGRVVAIGTTSARVLETVAQKDGRIKPASSRTEIYIYPPYRFKCVDCLLTNFHLPRSTLLLLVSAFAGKEKILFAYKEAVKKQYRFYSYGDAMFISDLLEKEKR